MLKPPAAPLWDRIAGLKPPASEAQKASPRSPKTPQESSDRSGYRAVWISDTHLGTKGCQADLLLEFLREVECDHLYLVGDIIDGWALKRSWYWDETHNQIARRILKLSSMGTRVTYICGNHDEFLRPYVGQVFGGVSLRDEAVHMTADGRRLWILHGDRFDICIRHARWLAVLGDRAYRFALQLNTVFNRVRRKLGRPYWSISAWLKSRVKNAVTYIDNFEEAVTSEAARRGYDGVVCGHIHSAQKREIDGVLYMNDGDWVESCTALVEHTDGELEIVRWNERIAERFDAPDLSRSEPALAGVA